MSQLRLVGLILFITAIFLGLAASVTQTSHIRFRKFDLFHPQKTQSPEAVNPPELPQSASPNSDSSNNGDVNSLIQNTTTQHKVEFVSIPISWPLIAAATLGLLLWFSSSSELRPRKFGSRRRR